MTLIKLPKRIMFISGPDTDKFLQGQCSIDIDNLTNSKVSFGTFNDPKGRMYCLFTALRYQEGIMLAMHESLFDETFNKLSKYKVFFKCTISESPWICTGIIDENSKQIPDTLKGVYQELESSELSHSESGIGINLPKSSLREFWFNKLHNDNVDISDAPELLKAWQYQYFLAGLPQLTDQTQGKFILQELNLQELDAVSFKKGCYTGQEIIARMKFLGKLKKRMYLLSADAEITLQENDKVYDQQQTKLGNIVCGVTNQGKSCFLAVLNSELAADSDFATNEDGTCQLKINALSY